MRAPRYVDAVAGVHTVHHLVHGAAVLWTLAALGLGLQALRSEGLACRQFFQAQMLVAESASGACSWYSGSSVQLQQLQHFGCPQFAATTAVSNFVF